MLDLGCHEGGYAIELGLHGATVVGLEGRPASLAKAQFAAEALGLGNVTFRLADVRQLAELDLGRFDVVLCLGILYHLRPEEAVALIEACARICDDLMVVRSTIAISDNLRTVVGGHAYSGRTHQENPANLGMSLDAHESVFPSRGTVIDLLNEVGFTSSFEVRHPVVPELELLLDSVTIAAVRGRPVSYRSMPRARPAARPQSPAERSHGVAAIRREPAARPLLACPRTPLPHLDPDRLPVAKAGRPLAERRATVTSRLPCRPSGTT